VVRGPCNAEHVTVTVTPGKTSLIIAASAARTPLIFW
jgi:hypothetical protein